MLRNFTGSTGVRAVIAVLMLLFVVACAGSDSGIKRDRDAAQAERDRIAAELAEEKRKAAEAAAAAAEQARKDAEAAAAAAAEQVRMDMQAAYERAKAAIAAAETAEAAQAAYDDEKANVSAAQGEMLQMAVDERTAALATADRAAEQREALMAAAGMIDTSDLSTQALVDAAQAGIRALRQALEDAADVSDADKAMYETQLAEATTDVDMAQGGINTAMRRMEQKMALSSASDALQTALAALSGSTPTEAQLAAARNALTDLNNAITGGEDLTEDEKAKYVHEAANAAAPISMAQTAFDNAEGEAKKTADADTAATAAKLYAGIAAPTATDATPDTSIRFAAYNSDDDAILVQNGVATADAQELSEDKKATVDDNHGWEGKKYTASGTSVAGTYEAVVYSNVGEPTMGPKFNSGTGTGNVGFALDATSGETPGLETITGYAPRVDSPSFDQSAGTKEFKLPTNAVRVMLSGTYHGVSGTYYCTPAADSTCASRKAARGYELGNTLDDTNAFTAGGWTFKPTNPDARVTEMSDANYVSYGWWLHTAENGKLTASAFVDQKGTGADVAAASGITVLQGTATYTGGAAGKYALSSSTGGTNDAGHFTARATLKADFSKNVSATGITGTIDQFKVGDDGEARDWEVELMGSAISDTGLIRALNADGTTEPVANDMGAKTKWTIGGTAADAGGSWTGALWANDEGGVPQVATGTFHSVYGTDGQMVGGFGATE